jgi:uncharacterized repeat protein (TIGR03847 family)
MARQIFDFGSPDRFVAGTVGSPGNRTFFLQAAKGRAIVSVVLEKIQVQVLAERVAALLEEVRRSGGGVPDALPPTARDDGPLAEPLVESFRVGTLTIGWDATRGEVLVEARAQVGDVEEEAAAVDLEDDDPTGPDLVRVRLAPEAALAFAERSLEVVAAGRPPCPLCGQPLDPGGHLCPRRNGYVH